MRYTYLIAPLLFLAASAVLAEDATRDFQPWGLINATAPLGPFPAIVPGAGNITRGSEVLVGGGLTFLTERSHVQGAAAAVVAPAVRLDVRQPITMAGRAASPNLNIYLTAGIRGNIARGAGGVTGANYRAQLFQDAGGGVFNPVAGMDINLGFAVAGAVNDFQVRHVLQPGGAFRLDVTSTLTDSTAAANVGNVNDVDFLTMVNANDQRGFFAALVASPTNLPNSRDAIGMDVLRTHPLLRMPDGNFPTGRNTVIGQIELGVPMSNHDDMPTAGANRVLTIDATAAGPIWRDEHATAVAGIMSSQNGGVDFGGVAPGARLFATGFRAYPGNSTQQVLRSMNYLLDQFPPAQVVNASFGVSNLVDVATPDGNTPSALLFDWAVDQRNVPIVVAAGNFGSAGRAPAPGTSGFGDNPNLINREQSIAGGSGGYNTISVGALDWNFGARAYFSSFGPTRNPGGRGKPDIMAPGLFILSTVVPDLDGDGRNNDYERVFFGIDDLLHPVAVPGNQPMAGSQINGTSFAAPHVTGAVADLIEWGRSFNAATHGVPNDPRVIKAAIMNTADRSVKRREGGNWGQTFADPMMISSPLDQQLGAGMIRLDQAMLQVRPKTARLADDLPAPNDYIYINTEPISWDRQIADQTASHRSRVDYKFKHALVKGQKLRATLDWHRAVAETDGNNVIEATDTYTYATPSLSNLDLQVWQKNSDAELPAYGNQRWVRNLSSASTVDNVELIHDYVIPKNGDYALDVVNRSTRAETFGIAYFVRGNPAAAGGRLLGAITPPPESVNPAVALINELLPVEAASNAVMKTTFNEDQLLSGMDQLLVLDDNGDFVYSAGAQYPIYFGPELRTNPSDRLSDRDWFDGGTVDLSALLSAGWRSVTSSPADAEGRLPATLIGDSMFLSELASHSPAEFPLEYNFVIDVERNALFTPDLDGIGWFEVVPEASTLVMLLVGAVLLLVRRLVGITAR